MALDAKTPQFFTDSSAFANKPEMVEQKTKFCVQLVEDRETKFGQKWYITIVLEGGDEQILTFGHGDSESKREQEFQVLSVTPEYLPIHSCTLKKWTFEGKSGYRIAARSGGGPCPCQPAKPQLDPFSPTFDDDIDALPDLQ